MIDIGEVVEKLAIANIKLYNICDEKADASRNPDKYTKEDLVRIMAQDIALCKERANLKNAIRTFHGQGLSEIKSYGKN